MAEWLRPGLWEVIMLSRGIKPGQVLIPKKSIQDVALVSITSALLYGRRKPNFFTFNLFFSFLKFEIFSILPLLFLIILGLPAMIPNFTGNLQLAGGNRFGFGFFWIE